MVRMFKYLKFLFLTLFVLGIRILNAQEDKLMRAQRLYDAKNAEAAKLCIDSVVTNTSTKDRSEAWTIRAYIYYELYKKSDRHKLENPLRETIIESIDRSNELKAEQDYKTQNDKLLNSISGHFYNIAGSLLQDSMNYQRSIIALNRFIEIQKKLGNANVAGEKEMEFNLAAGSIYSQKFNDDNTDVKSFEIAKVALLKVLEKQPMNESANMNMGIMYLNQATKMIEDIDAGGTKMEDLDVIQENASKLAKQAEQFILKVYNQNNKNGKAVLALYYVYRVLYDAEKMAAFEKKCKELNIEISGKQE